MPSEPRDSAQPPQKLGQRFLSLGRLLGARLPSILTLLILIFATLVWKDHSETVEIDKVATFISGIASAIAIVWLVAGFRIQSQELSLQREELKLQRIAAQQQAVELSNSARLNSLGQIKSLLDEAERAIRESALNLKSSLGIQSAFFEGMNHWKSIENSNDPNEVLLEYEKWLPIEAVARNHLRFISSALILYMDYHHPSVKIEHRNDPETFLYIYGSWGNNAPFISHHIGPANLLAQFVWMLKPGLERLRLAWLVASAKKFGRDKFKEGSLEEMRDKVLQRSDSLPNICNEWPN